MAACSDGCIWEGRDSGDGRLPHGADVRHLVQGAREIRELIEPVMNVVALQVPQPPKVRERLMDRDWHVSMTREPKRALRLILMTHMSHENIDLFLADLKEILADIN